MKNFKTLLAILAVLLFLPAAAFAAPVGKITYLEGAVDITSGDKARPAALNEPVSAGDILRSKAKAKAEVTFLDGNILRLAEGTRVRITDYQMGEGKTTTLDLLRGKTQNIVTGLAKGAKFEVHTPTAVCGVRGTNFFSFIENGASHFVPKESSIYGYNKKFSGDVKTVNPGLAIVIPDADQPPVIQPASSSELDKHTSDTAPGKPVEDPGKSGKQGAGGGDWAPPEDWKNKVPGESRLAADVVFPFTISPPPEAVTAQGRLWGVLSDFTGIGGTSLEMQYAANGYGGFLAPQLAVGNLTGVMEDTSGKVVGGLSGVMTSVPGSWLGAFSGLYYNGEGISLTLGYLSGDYSPATGLAKATGYATRTPVLIPNANPIFVPDQLAMMGFEVPLIEAVNVYPVNNGSSYVAYLYGDAAPPTNDMTYYSNIDMSMLSAWALADSSGEFAYDNAADRKSWVAKYGAFGFNYFGPYFVVGDITGAHPVNGGITDFSRLHLSGRDLLYISPGFNYFDEDLGQYVREPGLMGYYNLEYWYETGYGGYGGGAGTLELKPTAFSGWWGYGAGSLFTNEEGYAVYRADEFGGMGSWTAPWEAPADIKIAGLYFADYFGGGYGGMSGGDFAPGYLLSTPVTSRFFYDYFLEEDGQPLFYDGDFFGLAAGVVGPFAQTETGLWKRSARAALAALYLKEYEQDGTITRKAGWLTTYAPGSLTAEGGLTGAFYPNEMESGPYNFFRLDGTLTATPVDESTTYSNYTLKYNFNDGIRAGQIGTDARIEAEGGMAAYYFSAYNSDTGQTTDRPWGIFGLSLGGDADWEWNDETEEYELITSGNPALYFGTAASHDGKDIRIGGGSKTPGAKATYWLGRILGPTWTVTVPGETPGTGHGEINGPLNGLYLSQTEMGNFDGVFYGLYEAPGTTGGWWIGNGVGTYAGTPLTFGGKAQEQNYGIAGLWGSISPIADGAQAVTGILGLGTYATLPTGAWTAMTGGKWTTTGGHPVFWTAGIGGPAWGCDPNSCDFTANLISGRYATLDGEGVISSTFTGSYFPEIAVWFTQNAQFTLGALTTPYAFSSYIDGLTYRANLTGDDDDDTTFSLVEDGFQGIMGGISNNGYELTFLGRLDQMVIAQAAPSLSAGSISSHIPSAGFSDTFSGFIAAAIGSTNAVSGDIRALYAYTPATSEFSGSTPLNGYGGYAGIFYSDDIAGTFTPGTGMWNALGSPLFYQLIDYTPEGIAALTHSQAYDAGTVPVEVIAGGTPDLRQVDASMQSYLGESWGVWQSIYRGTYLGATPRKWIFTEGGDSLLTATSAGASGVQHLMYNLAAVNGVSTGKVVGAQGIWGDAPDAPSHTVVMGGIVKGIFDPITTPLTSAAWTAVGQGAFMKTEAFLAKVAGMSEAERANFERATKIPAFEVGMANLSGSTTDMTVNMNNVKFFRGQTDTVPSIWATNAVSGTYSNGAKDYTGTTVSLSGAALNGMTQGFTVQQWNTATSNWGATVSSSGSATLAATGITITDMRGAAAGTINTSAQSFSGTGAGVVKASAP